MIFLNWIMLFGLVALSIPVLVHLISRTRVRELDWGAMRFLLASLAARRRRLMLEELILLVIRCLAVAFVVLAMARPFLPTSSIVPTAFVLPALIFAAALAAVAAAFWNQPDTRRKVLRIITAIVIVALSAALLESRLQKRKWFSASDSRDTVILIDASTSMMIKVEGKTNFERAIEEARSIADLCRRGDGVALFLAGPVPHPIVRIPTSDRREVLAALDNPALRPLGGSLGVLEALNAAASSLSEGQSALKRIVLITDGQDAGWDVKGEGRWKYIADTFKNLPSKPQFICRRLPMPKSFRNVGIADIAFSRSVVGADRPVRIDVRVGNSGTMPIQPTGIELLVDGMTVLRQDFLKEIPAGAAESVRFDYRFEKSGRHLVTARAVCDDDLPNDNADNRVLDVLGRLPVLVVDGAPGERFFQGAASFIKIALTPRDESPAAGQAAPAAPENFLIEHTVVRATALDGVADLSAYRVIILANVPRLPKTATDRLEDFVKHGGGLLVAPGKHAEPEFYNSWRTPVGVAILPGTLVDRVSPSGAPAHFALKTFSHPALQLVAQGRFSDAGSALVKTFWRLSADASDPAVRISAALDNGSPLMIERKLGRGYILMTAIPFDRRDSNLPSLKCFLPLIHELVYYLAAPLLPDGNINPGVEMTVELSPRTAGFKVNPAAFDVYRSRQEPPIMVVTPSTNLVQAAAAPFNDSLVIRFAATQEPGLYRMLIPAALATCTNGAAPDAGIPFVVLGQGQETSMNALSDSDLAQLQSRVGMTVVNSKEELALAFGGEAPGREVWKWLALGALFLVIAECGVTRWIAIQRRFTTAEVVTLKSPTENAVHLKNLAAGGRGILRR